MKRTLAALAVVALAAGPAAAQETSPNATIRLIQLLIEKGVLTRDQAASLLAQAQSESRAARTRPPAPGTPAKGTAGAASLATAEPAAAPAVAPGTVRVTYVPQVVRDQIAAQVREQVLGETEKNGWAAPNALPEWTKRITVYGDVRARGEEVLVAPTKDDYRAGGQPSSVPEFVDFNAINNGSPFDVANVGGAGPPVLNATENRTRMRLRARLGIKATIDDWIGTDLRLATGNDNSPVSTNQTLGQTAPFGKYALWLDRAYIDVHAPKDSLRPFESVKAWIGRSPNPFWVSDLNYDDDLNFDGVSVQAVLPVHDRVKTWFTAGAFPVFNTDFNFSTNSTAKQSSHDKYLFAGQVGTDVKVSDEINAKLAAGLFAYSNIEGKASSPCTILTSSDVCDTDLTRTQFKQFGNTVFPIRTIVPLGTSTADPQYYGLASRFDVLDLHGQVALTRYDPYDVTLEGEFVKNLAYKQSAVVVRGPVNNIGNTPVDRDGNPVRDAQGNLAPGPYQGGDTGYLAKITLGRTEIQKANDWNAYVGYKYVESDAVVDALTDSDFHLGGTNARGFFLGGAYGVARGSYLSLRWLSARQVSGPAYKVDTVQLDLNAKF